MLHWVDSWSDDQCNDDHPLHSNPTFCFEWTKQDSACTKKTFNELRWIMKSKDKRQKDKRQKTKRQKDKRQKDETTKRLAGCSINRASTLLIIRRQENKVCWSSKDKSTYMPNLQRQKKNDRPRQRRCEEIILRGMKLGFWAMLKGTFQKLLSGFFSVQGGGYPPFPLRVLGRMIFR